MPGDYNQNGSVDAADYVAWRENEGATTRLPNDNGIGGTIGQAHYDLWRAHFGLPAGGGSGGAAGVTVPEPATLVPLMFAKVGSWCKRRHPSQRV